MDKSFQLLRRAIDLGDKLSNWVVSKSQSRAEMELLFDQIDRLNNAYTSMQYRTDKCLRLLGQEVNRGH